MCRMRFLRVAAALAVLLALAGCEQVFTYNVFSEFSRDPAKLSTQQKRSYAQSALESGDRESMNAAYQALRDEALKSDDPELTSVATDLALGASGINDVAPDLAEKAISGDLSDPDAIEDTVTDALDSIDTDSLEDVADLIKKTRENGGTVSEEQYVFAAAGVAAKEAKEAQDAGKDVDDLDAEDFQEAQDLVNTAKEDLESRGETSETLDLLEDYINGTS
ncbi:MAG: hypothetical protein ACOCYG_08515 [Spirochaetota bacterium]